MCRLLMRVSPLALTNDSAESAVNFSSKFSLKKCNTKLKADAV